MLGLAFNNTENALKCRIKEPWDFFHVVRIAIFAVLIIPIVLKLVDIPEDGSVRNVICDVNYLCFSVLALAAVFVIRKKGSFRERIRITVLLAVLALPALVFKLVLDVLSITGHIELVGTLLENGLASIVVGLLPVVGTIGLYLMMKKWLMS